MSGSLEGNKIAAAVLVAGLVAMGSGFVSTAVVHTNVPETPAFAVAIPETDGTAVVEAAPAEAEPVVALLASADVGSGQKVTRKCAACHSFEEGGPNKVGPNLWNIVNANIGGADGFNYSGALPGDQQWTYENLNAFLWNPKQWAPGTSMGYAGLSKVGDRADLIAYLRTLSGSPAPLPE